MTGLRRISSNSAFEKAVGYSRAVVDDDYVHVSGTTGFDYETMTIAEDTVEQAHQAFRNVAQVLSRARCSFANLVRVRYYLADRADYERLMPVFKQYLGPNPPAATAIVAGLVDPRMKIEIEAVARRPDGRREEA